MVMAKGCRASGTMKKLENCTVLAVVHAFLWGVLYMCVVFFRIGSDYIAQTDYFSTFEVPASTS